MDGGGPPQTLAQLRQRAFKPNCALVLVDFFIRRGIVRPETEPDYVALLQGCHAAHPFAAGTQEAPSV